MSASVRRGVWVSVRKVQCIVVQLGDDRRGSGGSGKYQLSLNTGVGSCGRREFLGLLQAESGTPSLSV